MSGSSAEVCRSLGKVRGSFAEVRCSFGKIRGDLGDMCGSLGEVVYCEVYINFKNICFKNPENYVGRNLIFAKSMKNNMLRNLV